MFILFWFESSGSIADSNSKVFDNEVSPFINSRLLILRQTCRSSADFQTFHPLSSIKSADEVKIIVDVEFHFLFRSSRPDVFCEKGVLRNFAKFTGKHQCQSLVFNKVAGTACNFTKKEILAQVFSSEFCEISKNTLFCRTPLVASSVYFLSSNQKLR